MINFANLSDRLYQYKFYICRADEDEKYAKEIQDKMTIDTAQRDKQRQM